MSTRTTADLPGPGPLAVAGTALRASSQHLALERWAVRYGTPYRLKVGPREAVVIGDQDAMNAILRERPAGYRRIARIEEVFAEIGFAHVFSAEGDEWKHKRRLAVRALNSNHLHRYFDIVETIVERLRSKLLAAARTDASIDIQRELVAYTVDVTAALAFGQDVNTLENPDDQLPTHTATILEHLARRVVAPVPYWRWIRLPADVRFDRSVYYLRVAVARLIAETREQVVARPQLREQPENFLQSMIAAQLEDGSFTNADITGSALGMLIAGGDTTAHTISWATWYLAQEPDVQARVASEADTPTDYESVSGFQYAEAVLREVLRLKPAGPVFAVEPLEDSVVGGLRIRRGTQVILLTRLATMDPACFGAPETFDPERWLRPPAEGAHDTSAFLPFGAGPRFCPGRNLALLEGKAALAMLARTFEIRLDDAAGPVRERFHFTMGPQGLRLRLRERRTGDVRAGQRNDRSTEGVPHV